MDTKGFPPSFHHLVIPTKAGTLYRRLDQALAIARADPTNKLCASLTPPASRLRQRPGTPGALDSIWSIHPDPGLRRGDERLGRSENNRLSRFPSPSKSEGPHRKTAYKVGVPGVRRTDEEPAAYCADRVFEQAVTYHCQQAGCPTLIGTDGPKNLLPTLYTIFGVEAAPSSLAQRETDRQRAGLAVGNRGYGGHARQGTQYHRGPYRRERRRGNSADATAC